MTALPYNFRLFPVGDLLSFGFNRRKNPPFHRVNAGLNHVSLHWNDIDALYYTVQYREGGAAWTTAYTGNGTSTTISGLKANTAYKVKCKAVLDHSGSGGGEGEEEPDDGEGEEEPGDGEGEEEPGDDEVSETITVKWETDTKKWDGKEETRPQFSSWYFLRHELPRSAAVSRRSQDRLGRVPL